eukprot:COSAG01_NODE_38907_length_483_cov_3.710938_1_plen_30_part_10
MLVSLSKKCTDNNQFYCEATATLEFDKDSV